MTPLVFNVRLAGQISLGYGGSGPVIFEPLINIDPIFQSQTLTGDADHGIRKVFGRIYDHGVEPKLDNPWEDGDDPDVGLVDGANDRKWSITVSKQMTVGVQYTFVVWLVYKANAEIDHQDAREFTFGVSSSSSGASGSQSSSSSASSMGSSSSTSSA